MTPPIEKNSSINTAMKTLGITRYEADRLDALDGKSDGKIKKDIFSEAQELLATYKEEGAAISAEDKPDFVDLSMNKVAQAIGASIARVGGIMGYVFKKEENTRLNEEEGETAMEISDVCEDADEYISENGSIEGFEAEIPGNVTSMTIQHETFANPEETNYAKFDANGQAEIKNGGVITRSSYTANGKEYELGYIWGI